MRFSAAAILCSILFTFDEAYSQKITISGYVKDAASEEALIVASVPHANSKTGAISNQLKDENV